MVESTRRILIVDDEEGVLFVLREILSELGSGYEVVPARNGQDALTKASQSPFDLLITDLRMPDMDGIELTRLIKAWNPAMVVIWMTAYGCDQVLNEAAALAVDRCMDKPLEVNEILQIVRKTLGLVIDGAQGRV